MTVRCKAVEVSTSLGICVCKAFGLVYLLRTKVFVLEELRVGETRLASAEDLDSLQSQVEVK